MCGMYKLSLLHCVWIYRMSGKIKRRILLLRPVAGWQLTLINICAKESSVKGSAYIFGRQSAWVIHLLSLREA